MSSGTDIYHEMIVDYSRNPINYGEIEDHDVTFHDSNPLCGDSIDIDMKIDDHKVTDIKFHGKGCAICMACTSVLTEITKGKSLDDVRKIEKNDVSAAANDYLKTLGYVSIAYSWIKVLEVSFSDYESNKEFYEDKINTAKFYFDKVLPRAEFHYKSAISGSSNIMNFKFN
jgi:SUF system NifU family Fe-S assembly protein